ncbi:MAG: hypothetical protein ACYCW6_17705 [Candidatus Xenobia bacterium]
MNVFIAFHLVAVLVWLFPNPTTPLRDALVPLFRPYLSLTGAWQSWDMFSPSPMEVNASLQAELQYQDGAIRPWPFPAGSERERKWRELLGSADYAELWPGQCRWLARTYGRPGCRIVAVRLIKQWQVIPEPGHGEEPPQQAVLYTWRVETP